MTSKQTDKINLKRLFSFTIIACVVLYSLYCFIIEPIYIASLYDVAYEGSALLDILYYLRRTVEVIAMSVCYAAAALSIYCKRKITFGGTFGIYLLLGAYKHVANLIVGWISGGGEPALLLLDALFVLAYLALEIIPFAIACIAFNVIFKRYRDRQEILIKAGKEEIAYPFKKLYDKRNPLMKAALVTAVALLVPKLIGKIVNDVVEIVEITNLPLMLVSYFLNIIFGLLGYIAVILSFILFFEKIEKYKD